MDKEIRNIRAAKKSARGEIRTQALRDLNKVKKACREAWAEALPWAKMATVSIYFTHTTVSRMLLS